MKIKYRGKMPGSVKKTRIVLEVLKGAKIQDIADKQKVSRETVRKWMEKGLEGMKEALSRKKRGRRPKNYIEKKNMRKAILNMEKKLKKAEKRIKKLERQHRQAAGEMQIARRALAFAAKHSENEAKKNRDTKLLLKKIFSKVPKRPYVKGGM